MSLLKPPVRAPLRREFTTLGCPMIHNKASWCRGLCQPYQGRGVCGRLAPHAMRSQIQRAIARHKAERAEAASA